MSLASFSTLARLGPTIRTGEAAAALNLSVSGASRLLRTLEARNLARHVKHGLWILGTDQIDPRALAAEITRPHPSYVSFASALSAHGMIDQVPREISLASLDEAKRVKTAFGTFVVHHLPPKLFGGWDERADVALARPEKALFDMAYVSAVHRGRPQFIPELDLPRDFDRSDLDRWLSRIDSPRLRTLTSQGLKYARGRAVR